MSTSDFDLRKRIYLLLKDISKLLENKDITEMVGAIRLVIESTPLSDDELNTICNTLDSIYKQQKEKLDVEFCYELLDELFTPLSTQASGDLLKLNSIERDTRAVFVDLRTQQAPYGVSPTFSAKPPLRNNLS